MDKLPHVVLARQDKVLLTYFTVRVPLESEIGVLGHAVPMYTRKSGRFGHWLLPFVMFKCYGHDYEPKSKKECANLI